MNYMRAKNYAATPVMEELRTLLSGLQTSDMRQSLVARGFGWHFDVGAFSTGITGGGAGTILDLDQPEFGISIPSGYTCIPLRMQVVCHTPLLATDADEAEILIAVDRAAAWAGDGTVTAETPTNMRSDITSACPLRCFSAATADITDPVLGIELARRAVTGDMNGTPANALWGQLDLVYEPMVPGFFVGPAAIYGYWGGTVATPGFAHLDFIAIPSSLITGLS